MHYLTCLRRRFYRCRLPKSTWFAPGLVVITSVFTFIAGLQFFPLPASLTHLPYARIALASDGTLLGASIAQDQQWRFAPVDTLPHKYQRALLVFEDQYFYYHPGINPGAIARALLGNWRAGKVTSGGSTLTMQLARMLRRNEAAKVPSRNLTSKFIETLRALQLEWHFSKDELLVHYASHAPFGGNIVGLRAASWRYFSRAPEHLSWAESALLAVLPNSPGLMHPGRQQVPLKIKRDKLLQRLHQRGDLSTLDYELARLEPLPERPQALPQEAPHVLDSLAAKYPGQALFHTTLDTYIQRNANQIAARHAVRLANEGAHNIALLVIDHQTQETLAYVGNHAWRGATAYSPHVDIVQRPRSTGSILKPLLYGLMLQEGDITPTSLIPDIPSQFGGYSPKNYDRMFRGAVPAHYALAHSLNIPAVRMLHSYGIGHFQQALTRLGMTTLFRPADDYGLTLILGGAEGTLWELTGIYARLAASARDGDQITRYAPALLRNHPKENNLPIVMVFNQGAAWLSLQALIEVARPGHDHYWRDFSGSQTIAWKTGTSYGLRDAWSIGSNGRYTVGVWVGNADGEAATFMSGQTSAAPILFDMFDALPSVNWFAKPQHALKKIAVCKVDGFLAGGQCAAMESEVPQSSHFETVTPHHRRIHLDAQGQFRVHSDCEAVSAMQSKDWFVLPPVQEFYWRQHHSDYPMMPPWRKDCLTNIATLDDDQPIELLYPREHSRVYLPTDLKGERSRVVLKAVHRNTSARLYWHLDNDFIGETQVFHERDVSLEPGIHKLLIFDQLGYQLQHRFRVIGTNEP